MKEEKLQPIKRIRKKIGDVIEILTSKGLAYVQYTHEHTKLPKWGSLIRILQGFYDIRPSQKELVELVKKPHRFRTFCPVYYGINTGDWKLVGNFPVPEFAQKFPIFKLSTALPGEDPLEKTWWLWDGEKEWKVGKLSLEEQKKYPLQKICNDTALIENIETAKSLGRELC